MIDIYGARAGEVLNLGRDHPDLLDVFDSETGAIGAELVFTYRAEFCRTLTDTLIRRIMVGFNGTCGRDALERAADILARHEGWDADRRSREIAGYTRYIARFDVLDRPAGARRPAPTSTAAPHAAPASILERQS
jgi:glycerol-3-phosphate dehydrogenase